MKCAFAFFSNKKEHWKNKDEVVKLGAITSKQLNFCVI